VLLLSVSAGPSGGVQSVVAPANQCKLVAYVNDPDPQGLNVRSGPGKQFPVLGKVPHRDVDLVNKTGVWVDVIGSTGQWLEIQDGETWGGSETLFKGPGWVYGPLLATQTFALGDIEKAVAKVYRAPTPGGALAGKLPPGTEMKITGCKGRWAQVEGNKMAGWLDGESQCAYLITTCG
jgi:SH3-like domain-containing protein